MVTINLFKYFVCKKILKNPPTVFNKLEICMQTLAVTHVKDCHHNIIMRLC
jgi:hypothetical protein